MAYFNRAPKMDKLDLTKDTEADIVRSLARGLGVLRAIRTFMPGAHKSGFDLTAALRSSKAPSVASRGGDACKFSEMLSA
jgi:hypothetical protein